MCRNIAPANRAVDALTRLAFPVIYAGKRAVAERIADSKRVYDVKITTEMTDGTYCTKRGHHIRPLSHSRMQLNPSHFPCPHATGSLEIEQQSVKGAIGPLARSMLAEVAYMQEEHEYLANAYDELKAELAHEESRTRKCAEEFGEYRAAAFNRIRKLEAEVAAAIAEKKKLEAEKKELCSQATNKLTENYVEIAQLTSKLDNAIQSYLSARSAPAAPAASAPAPSTIERKRTIRPADDSDSEDEVDVKRGRNGFPVGWVMGRSGLRVMGGRPATAADIIRVPRPGSMPAADGSAMRPRKIWHKQPMPVPPTTLPAEAPSVVIVEPESGSDISDDEDTDLSSISATGSDAGDVPCECPLQAAAHKHGDTLADGTLCECICSNCIGPIADAAASKDNNCICGPADHPKCNTRCSFKYCNTHLQQ